VTKSNWTLHLTNLNSGYLSGIKALKLADLMGGRGGALKSASLSAGIGLISHCKWDRLFSFSLTLALSF